MGGPYAVKRLLHFADLWQRALYLRGDPYESTKAVFGLKESSLVDVKMGTESELAMKYDLTQGWLW